MCASSFKSREESGVHARQASYESKSLNTVESPLICFPKHLYPLDPLPQSERYTLESSLVTTVFVVPSF